MTWILAVTGCGGDENGDGDSDSDTDVDSDTDGDTDVDTDSDVDDAGPDAAADAGLPPGYDCGGDDVLELHVVEVPRFRPNEDVPVEGAAVVVDCDDGRIEVTTDADGVARAYRLDFAGDPPEVTIYKAGYTTRTLFDVGGDRTVPRPFRIVLGSRANIPFARFDGDITRSADPSLVLAAVRGGGVAATSGGDTYGLALADDYEGTARLTGIELAVNDGGTATLVSFVEETVVHEGEDTVGPALVFPDVYGGVERFDVTVTYDLLADSPLDSRLALEDDDPNPTRAFYGALVTDLEEATNARNILGLTESTTPDGDDETFHVAYADEFEGTPLLLVFVASDDRQVYAIFRSNEVPPDPERTFVVEDGPEPTEVLPDDVYDYPGTTVLFTGARWANMRTVTITALGSEELYGGSASFWQLTLPTDRLGWRLPDPPTDVEWGELLPPFGNFALIFSAIEYAEDPLASYEVFTDRDFGRTHFLRSTSDARYRGTLDAPGG